MLRRLRPYAAELELRAVLVQRDERFLRVRGEGMTVERERHRGTSRVVGLGSWIAARTGKLGRRLAPILARPRFGVAADRATVELEIHPVGGLAAVLARQASAVVRAAADRRRALLAKTTHPPRAHPMQGRVPL